MPVRFALGPDASPVPGHDPVDDGQFNTGAAKFARVVETLEHTYMLTL